MLFAAGRASFDPVAALAAQLTANHGLRAVVVELNCGGAGLAGLFGLDDSRTLSAVVAGKLPATEAVQLTSGGLAVLPAGADIRRTGWRPAFNASFEEALRGLETSYDLILVDTPAVRMQTDALVAGAVVPRLLLVVESGRTVYEVVEGVARDLAAERIAIVACVLNKHRRFVPRWLYRWLSP